MSAYQVALKELVTKTGMSQDSWSSEDWKRVAELATEQDLTEAYEKTGLVAKRLARLGVLWPSKAKTLERVHQKITTHDGNYFKSVSDFIGFRVNCELEHIAVKLTLLRSLEDCVCYVRQPQFVDEKGKYRDITQYVYLYFTDVGNALQSSIGHVIELQIGHPFAAYTFMTDSLIRDRLTRIEKAKEQGIILDCKPAPVDLWRNNFYSNVKNYILGQANGENSLAKEEILEQAEVLFGSNPIPDELMTILNDLI